MIGTYHKQVPTDPAENVQFRRFVLTRALHSQRLRDQLLEACRRDIIFWINTFVWQFNPNAIGTGSMETGPFICWDFQIDAIETIFDHIRGRKDLLIEKSRELGASWLCLLAMDWSVLFERMKKYLCISRNEEAVDKPGESDSLFWKLDYIHKYLPTWMSERNGQILKRHKRLIHAPWTGSTISGQASTEKSGVGGRCTAMFMDEFSRIDADYSIYDHTSSTTSCRIFNGTHIGIGTKFYDLSQDDSISKLQMHWTHHPDKRKGLYKYNTHTNRIEIRDKEYEYPPEYQFVMSPQPVGGPFPGLRSPWYDASVKRMSQRAASMDLDINPTGAQSCFFDELMIVRLKDEHCRPPVAVGRLTHDQKGVPDKFIPDSGGPLSLWVNLDYNGNPPRDIFGVGADVANGFGRSPSTASVVTAGTGMKVAEYADRYITPEEFSRLLIALCRFFRTASGDGAWLAWENNGPGLKVMNDVVALGYRNIYYKVDDFDLNQKKSTKPGWTNQPKNFMLVMQDYQAALFGREFLNPSIKAMEETANFIYDGKGKLINAKAKKNDDPADAGDNHGDRVIADALSWMMVKGYSRLIEEEKKEEQQHDTRSLAGRRQLWEERRKEDAWLEDVEMAY